MKSKKCKKVKFKSLIEMRNKNSLANIMCSHKNARKPTIRGLLNKFLTIARNCTTDEKIKISAYLDYNETTFQLHAVTVLL